MDKREEFISLAFHFQRQENRLPARLDWRGENLAYFRDKHGRQYPAERQVQIQFGSWGKFIVACGGLPKTTQRIADIAIEHVVKKYDATVMPGNNGTIDCHIGDESYEVKGASLQTDSMVRTPRWRFRLHSRQYSLLVDKLILVGIAGDTPVAEWTFDKVDMVQHIDGKDALSVPAKAPFGTSYYNFYFMETWMENKTLDEIIQLQEDYDSEADS